MNSHITSFYYCSVEVQALIENNLKTSIFLLHLYIMSIKAKITYNVDGNAALQLIGTLSHFIARYLPSLKRWNQGRSLAGTVPIPAVVSIRSLEKSVKSRTIPYYRFK